MTIHGTYRVQCASDTCFRWLCSLELQNPEQEYYCSFFRDSAHEFHSREEAKKAALNAGWTEEGYAHKPLSDLNTFYCPACQRKKEKSND